MAEQVEKPGPAIETQTLVPLTERVKIHFGYLYDGGRMHDADCSD